MFQTPHFWAARQRKLCLLPYHDPSELQESACPVITDMSLDTISHHKRVELTVMAGRKLRYTPPLGAE
eukprot:1143962-Pelagomonas_calceolata.AAC.2